MARLADDQWVPSDAKAFNRWFYDRLERTEQMRSCIKYLKAWKNFSSCDLKGIHLTVLVGLTHVPVANSDDRSLTETVEKIVEYLKDNKAIYNPVDENENLIDGWSDGKVAAVIDDFEKLHAKASEAIAEEDKGIASKKWISVFGTDAARKYSLKSPWTRDADSAAIELIAGKEHTFELRPFEVLVFDVICPLLLVQCV